MKASFLIGDMPLYEPICYNLYSISYTTWACVTARGRLTCTEGQIELIRFYLLGWVTLRWRIFAIFSWDSSTLFLSKTGRPVISINVATPENNVKYVATTYIDIRQKYLKLFAFTFIPLRVCGVALHGVVRYVAWHVVACCVVCHVACHCMLCGMASWDMLCGMVRYAMWHGMAWYAM